MSWRGQAECSCGCLSSAPAGRNGGHLTPAPRLHFKDIADASSVENAKRSVELEDRAAKWVIDACEAEGWVGEVDLVKGGCVSSALP